tara:strand:- start:898 stop:1869 length:972 start_codon:yes stop_codon:yes gene_type:complete
VRPTIIILGQKTWLFFSELNLMDKHNLPKQFNFVLCPSFHGASLLAILLNNHSKIISLGDTIPTKKTEDFACSCGLLIGSCAFWRQIENTQSRYNHSRSQHITPLLPDLSVDAIERINRLNTHFQKFFSIWSFFPEKRKNFRKSVEAFYTEATSFHKKKVFIDGTKDINRCLCIKNIVSEKIRVIHLIRDPRAYITSLKRNFPKPENHLILGSKMWKGFHGTVLQSFTQMDNCEYLPVFYENLSIKPRVEMKRIFKFLELEEENVFSTPKEPHHIIGNRMIGKFNGDISQDSEWKKLMNSDEQEEIMKYCEPIASLFNYQLEK